MNCPYSVSAGGVSGSEGVSDVSGVAEDCVPDEEELSDGSETEELSELDGSDVLVLSELWFSDTVLSVDDVSELSLDELIFEEDGEDDGVLLDDGLLDEEYLPAYQSFFSIPFLSI